MKILKIQLSQLDNENSVLKRKLDCHEQKVTRILRERDEQAKLAAERQKCNEYLDNQLAVTQRRQVLLVAEMHRVEAQVDLIKDTLLGARAHEFEKEKNWKNNKNRFKKGAKLVLLAVAGHLQTDNTSVAR